MNSKDDVVLIRFSPLCVLYISITSGHPIHMTEMGGSTLTCGGSQQQDTDGRKKRKSFWTSRCVEDVEDLLGDNHATESDA